MSIELITKYSPKVDEAFSAESKLSLLTNTDYDWSGAKTVSVYRFATAEMNDYVRNRFDGEDTDASISRYGNIYDLSSQVQDMLLTKDRSFIFNIDRMDEDETAQRAGAALARQISEVVIPEVDRYVYGKMVAGAGTTATEADLTAVNIYDAIIAGSEILDDAQVPDTERVIVVTPAVYRLMKQSQGINLECDIAQDQRARGVIAMVDGMAVVKIPTSRLPEGFGFMICHPSATTAPVKLADYGQHSDTALSSGTLVTGRVVYDAFVLENKAKAIYYQPVSTVEG